MGLSPCPPRVVQCRLIGDPATLGHRKSLRKCNDLGGTRPPARGLRTCWLSIFKARSPSHFYCGQGWFGLISVPQFCGTGGVVPPVGGGAPIGGGGPPCATSKLRIVPPVEYFMSPLGVIQAIWPASVRLAVFPLGVRYVAPVPETSRIFAVQSISHRCPFGSRPSLQSFGVIVISTTVPRTPSDPYGLLT